VAGVGGRHPLCRRGCRRPTRRYGHTAVGHGGPWATAGAALTAVAHGGRLRGPLSTVAHGGCVANRRGARRRRGGRRLVAKSAKISNGPIILQND
jgi:hypothetical protein